MRYTPALAMILFSSLIHAPAAAQRNAVRCGPQGDIIDLGFAPRSLKELIDDSRFVADVTVTAIQPGRRTHSDVLLKVHETIKGPALPTSIVAELGWSMAPGRNIVFLDHSYFGPDYFGPEGSADAYPLRPDTPRYDFVYGQAYGFCVEDGRIRMTPRELPEFKNVASDVTPEKIVAEIRAYVEARRIPGRITVDGGGSLPIPSTVRGDQPELRVALTALNSTEQRLLTAPVAVLEDGRAQFPASIGRIGSSGDFTLAVTDGTYSVSVQGLPEGYRVKSARFGSLDVLSAPMRINGSSSDEIRVLLTPPDSTAVGGKVRGHVSSAPLAEIPANVWVSMQPDPLPAGRLIAGAVPVQRDGSFEFSSLKIGNYKMRVELRPDAPLAGNFWIGMSEQSVFVNAFDFDGITIPLLPGAPVSGKVAAIGAADRSKIFVGFSGLTSHYAQFFPVAPDGSFRIWIPAGNYRVRIRPTGGPDTVRTRMMDSAVDLEMIKTNGITAVGPLEVVVGQNP